jgi:hypothetical protein
MGQNTKAGEQAQSAILGASAFTLEKSWRLRRSWGNNHNNGELLKKMRMLRDIVSQRNTSIVLLVGTVA